MARREGEITPARAAKLLGVHRDTVYRWIANAFDGHGSTKFERDDVRRDVGGFIWVLKSRIDCLLHAANS